MGPMNGMRIVQSVTGSGTNTRPPTMMLPVVRFMSTLLCDGDAECRIAQGDDEGVRAIFGNLPRDDQFVEDQGCRATGAAVENLAAFVRPPVDPCAVQIARQD